MKERGKCEGAGMVVGDLTAYLPAILQGPLLAAKR